MSDLYLKAVPVGPMANFAYLVGSLKTRTCYAVDPAWDVQAIRDVAAADGLRITGALISHYHPDHCGGHLWGHDIQGVAELVEREPMPIYAHKDEIDGIAQVTGLARSDLQAVAGGDRLAVGDVEITMMHTPGHTPGSQCFLCRDHLISGDTLFLTGCGRVDLPGGDAGELYESLSTKIAKLPRSTVVHPGHHYDAEESATLAEVARRNPYLTATSLAAWKRLMGAP